jgi:hypothetical protein
MHVPMSVHIESHDNANLHAQSGTHAHRAIALCRVTVGYTHMLRRVHLCPEACNLSMQHTSMDT